MSARYFRTPHLLLLGTGVLVAAQGQCAEWLVNPTARVDTGYTDNPRLLPEGGATSASAAGDLQLVLRRRSARSDFMLQPRVRSLRYRDEDSLDSDYAYLDTAFSHRSERVDWMASAGFVRDTTLVSELESTGVVQVDRTHESIKLSVGPTARLSERTSVGLQASWIDNHYVDAELTGLTDYEYGSLSLSSTFVLSELSWITLTAQAGELRVPSRPLSDQQDAMLRLGWRYQPSALWSAGVSVGPSFARSEFAENDGAVYMADVRRDAERWSLSGSVSREVLPSGLGALSRREQVSLAITHALSERLSIALSARGISNEDALLPVPGSIVNEMEYGQIDLQMNWVLAKHWRIAASLSAATQSYTLRPQSAQRYQAAMSIVWNGRTHFL